LWQGVGKPHASSEKRPKAFRFRKNQQYVRLYPQLLNKHPRIYFPQRAFGKSHFFR